MSKDITLAQLTIVTDNLRRFETLVATDLTQNKEVLLYCLLKAKTQLENIIEDFQNEIEQIGC